MLIWADVNCQASERGLSSGRLGVRRSCPYVMEQRQCIRRGGGSWVSVIVEDVQCTGAAGSQHGQSAFAAHAAHGLPNEESIEHSALTNGDTPSQPPHPASYMELSVIVDSACTYTTAQALEGWDKRLRRTQCHNLGSLCH